MKYSRPPSLKRGDTIGILAPSSGAAKLFPHRLERGCKALEKLGFNVKLYRTCYKLLDGKAGTAEERAADINEAFGDKNINGIISAIGGICANEILNFLDYDLIRSNPKIFCGYSDVTILHCALAKRANLISFYGPCLMTQFGEYPEPLEYSVRSFLDATTKLDNPGKIEPSAAWTDEILDWNKKLDLTRSRRLTANSGPIWLREGQAKGLLSGGCLHSIHQLQGTPFKCETAGRIFFFEVSEGQSFNDGYPLSYVESQLVDLRLSGLFDEISGLLIGRPPFYSEDRVQQFYDVVKRVTAHTSFPILAGLDFGHTDPILTIPLHTHSSMDSSMNCWSIDESGITA